MDFIKKRKGDGDVGRGKKRRGWKGRKSTTEAELPSTHPKKGKWKLSPSI